MLVATVVVGMSSTVARAEGGLSSLCPLGCCHAKETSRANISTVANSGGGVKTPAVFTKMSSGTKQIVTNTKNLFSFRKPGASDEKAGGKYAFRPDHKEPGFFYKLFHPEPTPPPRTIDEWLSLEQVHP
jgi:hypothetical protein